MEVKVQKKGPVNAACVWKVERSLPQDLGCV